jgi:23S rRNA pseudouridine2605 synthase
VLRPRDNDDWPDLPLQIEMEGEQVSFSAVERLEGGGTNVWFRVASERPLPRGALRALFDGASLKVSRTLLVSWGPLTLPRDLPRGRSRDIEGPQLETLLGLAGRKPQPRGRAGARGARGRRTTARRSGDR